MRVFARHDLAPAAPSDGRGELLLEGSWPEAWRAPKRRSLDDSIDARHAWIDAAALDWAEELGRPAAGAGDELSFAYLNALALRYYLVKLLRVVAFFEDVAAPAADEVLELHVERGRDEDYVDVLSSIARRAAATLRTVWHEGNCGLRIADCGLEKRTLGSPKIRNPQSPSVRNPQSAIRKLLQSAIRNPQSAISFNPPSAIKRVVLCGNPQVLDPVCAELVQRGCRVWWLYERFAVRCWWRWRRWGVGQVLCNEPGGGPGAFSDGWIGRDVVVRGVDLAPALERWLTRRAAEAGRSQARLVERVDRHLRGLRPDVLLLDEDATPLKRAAAALARQHGVGSLVVQHGAPCGPFGFVPLAADGICVWGEATREQLVHWGVEPERIHVVGWPRWNPPSTARPAASRKTVLLLATVPPSDHRPDGVTFHLTRRTHEEMLRTACAAVAAIAGARLVVKLHPRTRDARALRAMLAEEVQARCPGLAVRFARGGPLERWPAKADCVLSCASTAGIEAALAGAPVVQLLPAGSGDVLPADAWGLIGSARGEDELRPLLAAALARGWQQPVADDTAVVAASGRRAAARVVDLALGVGQGTGHRESRLFSAFGGRSHRRAESGEMKSAK